MKKTRIIKVCEQVEDVPKLPARSKFHVDPTVDYLLPLCAKAVGLYLFTLFDEPNREFIDTLLTDWRPELVQWAVFGYRGYFDANVKTNFLMLLRNVRARQLTSIGIASGIAVIAGLAVGAGWTVDHDVRIWLAPPFLPTLSTPASAVLPN